MMSSDPQLGNLDVLSDELVLHFMLEIDSLEDLSSWCRASQKAKKLCKDEFFWKQKYRKDIGPTNVQPKIGWKLAYASIYPSTKIVQSPPIVTTDHAYGIITDAGELYLGGKLSDRIFGLAGKTISNYSPTPLKFPGKVVSFSISETKNLSSSIFHRFAVVLENGDIYHWGTVKDNYHQVSKVEENTEAVRIVIGPSGYAYIDKNKKLYYNIDSNAKNLEVKGDISGDTIDMFVLGDTRKFIFNIFALQKNGNVANIYQSALNQNIYVDNIDMYQPMMKILPRMDSDSFLILSTDRRVYLWKRIEYLKDDEIYEKRKLTEINFPEKIRHLYQSPSSFVFVQSVSGKLYLNGNVLRSGIEDIHKLYSSSKSSSSSKLVEIEIGHPIIFAANGIDFGLAVASDGVVNFWKNSIPFYLLTNRGGAIKPGQTIHGYNSLTCENSFYKILKITEAGNLQTVKLVTESEPVGSGQGHIRSRVWPKYNGTYFRIGSKISGKRIIGGFTFRKRKDGYGLKTISITGRYDPAKKYFDGPC